MRNKFFFILAVIISSSALADQTGQEARAEALFKEIRCVVCQGESIAESRAPSADDMRRFVRERMTAGDSDETIEQALVARYGDAVLMRPPFTHSTWLLWLGPLLILAMGAFLARRRFAAAAETGK